MASHIATPKGEHERKAGRKGAKTRQNESANARWRVVEWEGRRGHKQNRKGGRMKVKEVTDCLNIHSQAHNWQQWRGGPQG